MFAAVVVGKLEAAVGVAGRWALEGLVPLLGFAGSLRQAAVNVVVVVQDNFPIVSNHAYAGIVVP